MREPSPSEATSARWSSRSSSRAACSAAGTSAKAPRTPAPYVSTSRRRASVLMRSPPVENASQRSGESAPGFDGVGQECPAAVVQPVVLAVRSLLGRDDVGVERAGLVEATQGSIDGGVPHLGQPRVAQPPDHVVAVAVAL